MTRTPALSIVAPCFNEAAGLAVFHERASRAAVAVVADSHEIVLVDDGSHDDTWAVIVALSLRDPRVVGVRLMRNHGHQLAASAGLSLARGERVMLIDADLQDPPELLGALMAELDRGADVAYGRRIARAGETRFKRVTAALFYRILTRLSQTPIPQDAGDFRLMTRTVVDALVAMPERHRFIRGMVSWIGGRQVAVPYERDARSAGVSQYPLTRMVRLAIDAITSFSIAPLRFATWLGVIVSALAFLLILYTVFRWAGGHVIAGWTSTVVAGSFFAGVQLLVLGIMGEYLGRMVEELKGRPLFLIGAITREGRTAPPSVASQDREDTEADQGDPARHPRGIDPFPHGSYPGKEETELNDPTPPRAGPRGGSGARRA